MKLAVFLIEEAKYKGYPDSGKAQLPRPPSVTNLYKHFGGLELEEESNMSVEEENVNEALISMTQNTLAKITQTTINSNLSEALELGANGVIKTYFILMKGFIGIGILYIPLYYKSMGYAFSSGILLIISLLVLAGLARLVECRAKTKVSYPEIVEISLGKFMSVVVGILLFVGQILYGTAYLGYVIMNITGMIKYADNSSNTNIIEYSLGSILILILGPIMCIRKLERLNILFVITSILMIISLISFTIPRIIGIHKSSFIPYEFTNWGAKLMDFMGICLFSFEGYGIVIPSQQQMSKKIYYTPTFSICMGSVFIFYIFIGLFTSIEASKELTNVINFETLVHQIGLKDYTAYIVSSIYMFCLIPGYIMLMYPSLRIMEKLLARLFVENGRKQYLQNIFRILLVGITIIVGIFWGSYSTEFIVKMGYLICLPLIVILPSFSHLKIVAESFWNKFIDIIIFVGGILLLSVGILYFAFPTSFKDKY